MTVVLFVSDAPNSEAKPDHHLNETQQLGRQESPPSIAQALKATIKLRVSLED